MCVTNHLQHFHLTLSWFKGKGTWKKASIVSILFKRLCIYNCWQRFLRYIFVLLKTTQITFPSPWYSPHFETPYKTDQSSRKGETISLDLLLLKRMVSHLSTMFCLTGFVCQLAFVRTRKKPIERMKEIWKGRPGELWAARCSLATKKRQKNEPEGSQQLNHSSFLFPSSFFALLLTYMADGQFQKWGKWTCCVLLIPRLSGQQLK